MREIANPFEAVQWQAALGDECFVQKLRERLESAATSVGFSPVTTYSMMYDALGRCVKRSLTSGPTTYYIYDGEKPILEYDGGGGSAGVNLYGKGIDEIVMRIAIGADSNWWTYYSQQNHEGSVTLLTDGSGSVLERYRYDAFGAPTIYDQNWNVRSATIYDNRFLFTGREYAATYRSSYTNAALNFYEYRARAYNPKIGRFMSEDPKVFDAGDYNLFRYCHNDPIDMTDPMGLDTQVTLEYYPLGEASIFGHQYLYARDTKTGDSVISRAGPSEKYRQGSLAHNVLSNSTEKSASGLGNITIKTALTRTQDSVDAGQKSKAVSGSRVVLKEDLSAVRDTLQKFNNAVDSANINYKPTTTNSNAYAATAYNVLTGEAPPVSERLPGSEVDLRDNKNLQRSFVHNQPQQQQPQPQQNYPRFQDPSTLYFIQLIH